MAGGRESDLGSPERLELIRDLVSRAPVEASWRSIDQEFDRKLGDIGDRKLLARAIVDEFSMRYTFKRSSTSWAKYILALTLLMYDLPPVEEISGLVGVPYRLLYRRAKSGVRGALLDAQGRRLQGVQSPSIGQVASRRAEGLPSWHRSWRSVR